jgi:hydroxymethylpyrimidine pyrophosphatase-like HAD family hydrolase/hypoxanthine phosphoribosyltransferase
MLLKEEREYYQRYRWTLLPFLSLEKIINRISSLVNEDISLDPEWCRREWNVNLYMLSCAAADIVDDYLVRGIFSLSKIADYFSLMDTPVKLIIKITAIISRIRGAMRDRALRRWRKGWADWCIYISSKLVEENIPSRGEINDFSQKLIPLLKYKFPNALLKVRTRIPAAYRSQDLTHYDFISLTNQYIDMHHHPKSPHLIIGLRTAGSYIAPLVCARLRSDGYEHVSFMTLRPKNFIHPWDKILLGRNIESHTRFILVDEPAGTGKTISNCVNILKKFDVNKERISVMVPTHPAKRDWLDASIKKSLEGCDIISLEPEQWYKVRSLDAREFQNAIRPYFAQLGFNDVEVMETEYTRKINNELAQNPDHAYHVRLKKVFQVVPKGDSLPEHAVLVLAKSVGWGWLGYHAAIAASCLSEYTPKVYGVRKGMMYLEWVDHFARKEGGQKNQDHLAENLSKYIGRRTSQLRLEENPAPFLSNYRESGLQSIAIILSNVFGPKVSKLKRGWIRNQLEKLDCSVPTLLDSRMEKNEWISSERGLLKTDFEHHGFSKTASHNIVDPAYDMARAMLEFELSDKEKDEFVDKYIHETADSSIKTRLIYYKLLVGSEAMSEALNRLNKIEYYFKYPELNQTYVNSWKFLVSEMMEYTGELCEGEPIRHWRKPMFVMDIDDVLDKNIFGFPSTTANGVYSISLLRMHGICSIVNTARSLDEVKEYCRHYGFPGGIAEYGSVIWDEAEQRAEVLVSPEALEEIRALEKALMAIPGIFINPFYQYSIRAYSFDRHRTIPIPEATIGGLFEKLGIKHLISKRTHIDTAILSRDVDKGRALIKLKEFKGIKNGEIGAIGDTESDLPMLIVADKGFLVRNSTIDLKRAARKFGVSVVTSSFQGGLLEAVEIFSHGTNGVGCTHCRAALEKLRGKRDLLWRLLKIADMSTIQHWLRIFERNVLELFQD